MAADKRYLYVSLQSDLQEIGKMAHSIKKEREMVGITRVRFTRNGGNGAFNIQVPNTKEPPGREIFEKKCPTSAHAMGSNSTKHLGWVKESPQMYLHYEAPRTQSANLGVNRVSSMNLRDDCWVGVHVMAVSRERSPRTVLDTPLS